MSGILSKMSTFNSFLGVDFPSPPPYSGPRQSNTAIAKPKAEQNRPSCWSNSQGGADNII